MGGGDTDLRTGTFFFTPHKKRCDGSDKALFGTDCSFYARTNAFMKEVEGYCHAEGLCGGNSCFKDLRFCDVTTFDPNDYYIGIGFWPGLPACLQAVLFVPPLCGACARCRMCVCLTSIEARIPPSHRHLHRRKYCYKRVHSRWRSD